MADEANKPAADDTEDTGARDAGARDTGTKDTGESAGSAADDMKARFREALAHKQGHGAPGRPGSGQPHLGGHANEKVQRQFRRKSG
ncbi:DUF5302 domain-containing protein [Motilibacter deserti]|uniref:DUF5302 domain-containing protein n=1 Tax=Motilibacter deserti TaxID=2714956 RepID=A0ABX0GSI8_9ACTN|nr:DUF5302 domain-containing protein [Motilibacter deserti]NHC13732.1 DUF5302 domain-containing protein [Motilibacter deserti]